MNALRRLAPLALLAVLPLPARAQTAAPVLDLDRGAPAIGVSASPREFTVVAGKLFFTAEEPSSGRELWVSDGTALGTQLLADLCPGSCSSNPVPRGALGGVLLFTDDSGSLWRSDGTRAGTFALAARAESVAFLARVALFPACDDSACRLWTTDGTAGGTHAVTDLGEGRLGNDTFQGFVAGRRVFWVRSSPYAGTGVRGLWVTDGTYSAGLTVPSSKVRLFAAAAGRLFFLAPAPQNSGEELWTSDGTEAGTRPLTQFTPESPFAATLALKTGETGVYFAADDGIHGVDLWKSDGTPVGTVRVTALAPDQPFVPGLDPLQVEEVGSRVVIVAFDEASGYRLFASGGTPASTVSLGGMAVSPYTGLQKSDGRIYFRADDGVHGYELWSTDGTPSGTAMVRDVCPGACDSQLSRPQAFGNGVALLASDGTHGPQVWTSDGTAAGTRARTALASGALSAERFEVAVLGARFLFPARDGHGDELWAAGAGAGDGQLVENIAQTGSSSAPRELRQMGDRLVFTACDGTFREVWASDGTAAVSVQLSDFQAADSCREYAEDAQMYLTPDGGGGSYFWHHRQRELWLWRTDGSPAGLTGVPLAGADPGRGLAVRDGIAYFSLAPSTGGAYELWRSDGTMAGTRKVTTLPGATPTSIASPGYLVWFGQSLYVGMPGGLYRSDGVSAELAAVSLAPAFFNTPYFTRVSGLLYFVAGGSLWRSDGTGPGTRTVSSSPPDVVGMTELGGNLFLLARSNVPTGTEVWRSDGTATGMVRLGQFPGYLNSNFPSSLVVAAGRLFFTVADDAHGRELWSSDGTAGGTVLVRDLYPGPVSSNPSGLTAFANKLYFAASDSVHGRELWVSDGSAAGTRLAQDVAPEGISSSPDELTAVGDRLFFTADDGISGRELWVLPGSAGCQPAADRLCLGGGRFAVTVAWRDFSGNTGTGQAIPLTADTGGFWFFSPANLELAVKVLDGRALNSAFWVFYGSLSTVEYEITVTDTQTGLTRRYQNPPGQFASVGDTHGFGPEGAYAAVAGVAPRAAQAGSCTPGPERLCLNGGRFKVEATWKDFSGNTGTGQAIPLSADTGTFWFFGPTNLEVFAKVLDGRALNGKFWFFYAALSNVDYTLTVTDTVTGAVRVYHNPAGQLASAGDTGAF